jgi:hypothetical protein
MSSSWRAQPPSAPLRAAVLGAPRVLAAGSGQTLAFFADPVPLYDTRGHAKLGHGADVSLGPFPCGGVAVSCPTAITEWSAI